jgi:hypothetical protein
MPHNTDGGGGKVVTFPTSAEERKALRKAKQDLEKQRLMDIFVDEGGGALFLNLDEVPYADVIIGGHRETWPIRSTRFRSEYMRYLKRQADQSANADPISVIASVISLKKSAINDAIERFEARAFSESTVRDVFVRVAGNDGDIFIDLGTPNWECIRITPAGWNIVESPPVRFRRPKGMLPLPIPVRGGGIEALRPFLNTTASDFVLVEAYLLASLHPRGPYPVLSLYGEQGAAKTNFLRVLRKLIDPNTIPTSGPPCSVRDLFIAANNMHFLAFENLSKLSDAMSDAFCRLATGGGQRVRKLFKDTDETLLRGSRPIAFEGIENVITRADLQDRSLIFLLQNLSGYEPERKLLPKLELQLPGIFGGLLDKMARGLEMLPMTDLPNAPRMADFAHWATACGVEGFEAAYAANRQNAIEVMLSHDPIAKELRALPKKWTGTMESLLDVVGPTTGIKSTKKLSDDLRRLAPMLRSTGIEVTHEQRKNVRRPIRIERITGEPEG